MVKNMEKEKISNIVQDISMKKCGIIIHNLGENIPLGSPQYIPNIVKEKSSNNVQDVSLQKFGIRPMCKSKHKIPMCTQRRYNGMYNSVN